MNQPAVCPVIQRLSDTFNSLKPVTHHDYLYSCGTDEPIHLIVSSHAVSQSSQLASLMELNVCSKYKYSSILRLVQ